MSKAFREIKTITGNFMRVNICPLRQYQYGRKKKSKPTAAAQEKLNRENRTRLLSDIINLNFDRTSLQLKLDYTDFRATYGRNPEPEEVVKEIRNFMRRLKRLYTSLGIELKYIYCSEIGARGHLSHHHVIINAGASYEAIRALWTNGGIWTRKLYFDRKGAYDLASYFVKSKYTYRSYTCSKNCTRPHDTGKDKCIFKNDYSIHQKQVNYFTNGDIAEIAKLYPGWEIAEMPTIAQTLDTDTGELRLPKWGVFITLYLYKPEGLSDQASAWDKYANITEWRNNHGENRKNSI